LKASTDRILTTHVGSLPRSPAVVDCLLRKEKGEEVDAGQFERTMRQGVLDIVRRQAEVGIDVVSDGETSKISYSTYIKDRYAGFGGEQPPPRPGLGRARPPARRPAAAARRRGRRTLPWIPGA
jgi:5-methyltetrahydropteroyltriglutamate--homocysteine methyltransferase